MTSEIIAADALRRAVEWVRGQVARDRENRYSLLRDWQLPAAFCSFWPDDIGGCLLGCLGVPEFGTEFAMSMLMDTKPEYLCEFFYGCLHRFDVN